MDTYNTHENNVKLHESQQGHKLIISQTYVTHQSCIGGKQTYTSSLRPHILHTPALVLERQEQLFN